MVHNVRRVLREEILMRYRAIHAQDCRDPIRLVIHQESREPYGSPRIWDALIKQGHHIGAHRVDRLMRIDGIRAKTVTPWRATTQSNHRWPVAENTLNRQFTVEAPNRVWAGDCTDVWTTAGWFFLAVILDLSSRRVIGWAMGHRLTVELAEQARTIALANRNPLADSCTTQIAAVSMPPRGTSWCCPLTASPPV